MRIRNLLRAGLTASAVRLLVASAGLLTLAFPARAQFAERQTIIRDSVDSWTGAIAFRAKDSGTIPGQIPGVNMTFDGEHMFTGKVMLHRDTKIGGWTGSIDGKFIINETSSVNSPGCTTKQSLIVEGSLTSDARGLPLTFSLTMDPQTDTWSIWPSSQYVNGNIRATTECAGVVQNNDRTLMVRYGPLNQMMRMPLPKDSLALKGSGRVPCSACMNVASDDKWTYDFTYDLQPVAKELELLIDPKNYDSWRPQAGANEEAMGNTLPVDVHLRLSDGSKPDTGAVKIVFELVKTSKEPGVAMNFPAASKAKKSYDMKMIADNNQSTLIIGQGSDGQRAATIKGPYFDYTATITSYDWGGWSALKATAYLPGGGTVVGHLINDKSMKEVRLPMRKEDSHIADGWKNSTDGATGKDDSDDDNEPEGDGEKGDGLTLYEEYRGFMVNGMHVSGKPQKKDLFIRNRIGADAEGGIFIFTEDSGIEVHKDLTADEISDDRLINFNHGQGAHKTEQHGVILETNPGMSGANAWDEKGSDPGPPRNTQRVIVQPADKQTDEVNPYGTSSGNKQNIFDRMVAHELMHTVGVWHHGEEDYMWFTTAPHLISPFMKGFPTGGKPYFSKGISYFNDAGALWEQRPFDAGPAQKIYIYTEQNEDYAQCLYSKWVGDIQIHADEYKSMDPSNLGAWSGAGQTVGLKGGQHSGNEQCLMRYYFAEFYPKDGSDNTFYTRRYCSRPFAASDEPIGLQLCSSRTGTGVNDSGRTPQSRYFDANEIRGDCAHQIVVNDSASPKNRSIGKKGS